MSSGDEVPRRSSTMLSLPRTPQGAHAAADGVAFVAHADAGTPSSVVLETVSSLVAGAGVSASSALIAPSSATLLAGGVVVGLLLAGTLALVTLRTRGTTGEERAEPADDDAPAHPDAWRVRRLLDEHGGRLPQSEIVERTGWSKSKVSRVLSAMADDGQIQKIRIGRENLVTRPGDEPEHAGGPFDE